MKVGITNLLIAKSGHVISAQWVIIFEWRTKHSSVRYSAIEYLDMIRSANSVEYVNTNWWQQSRYQFYDNLSTVHLKKGKIVELNIATMRDSVKRRCFSLEFKEETRYF